MDAIEKIATIMDEELKKLQDATSEYHVSREQLISTLKEFLEEWKNSTMDDLASSELKRMVILEELETIYYLRRGRSDIYRIYAEDYMYKDFNYAEKVDIERLDTSKLIAIVTGLKGNLDYYRYMILDYTR